MKELFFLVSFLAFIGLSSAWAQGTGIAPTIGSTHTYSITAGYGGSTISWEVRKSIVGGTNVLGATAGVGVEVIGTGTATSPTNQPYTASISLTWSNAIPGTNYFLVVKETASSANGGCSNTKAIAIIPQAVELDIVSLEKNSGDNNYTAKAISETASSACAADVVVTSWNGGNVNNIANAQNFTYTYGKTYLFYKITARNVSNISWKPSLSLSNTNSTNSTTVIKFGTAAPTGTGDQGASYNPFTNGVTINAGITEIYVQVEVDNGTSTSGDEGTLVQTWTPTLTAIDGNNNTITKINGDTDTGNDKANNQIKARPTTSVITTTAP